MFKRPHSSGTSPRRWEQLCLCRRNKGAHRGDARGISWLCVSYSFLLIAGSLIHLLAHRVNDLLRDKLHYQSSQLAETKDRVRDLEATEKGRLTEIVTILHGTGPGAVGETAEGGLGETCFLLY